MQERAICKIQKTKLEENFSSQNDYQTSEGVDFDPTRDRNLSYIRLISRYVYKDHRPIQ